MVTANFQDFIKIDSVSSEAVRTKKTISPAKQSNSAVTESVIKCNQNILVFMQNKIAKSPNKQRLSAIHL